MRARIGRVAALTFALMIGTGAVGTLVAADPATDGSPSGSPSDVAYRAYVSRGVTVAQDSSLYVPLRDVAGRIAPLAARTLGSKPNFILIHDDAPDAFAVAGGDVFVTDSLIGFVENREELSGILCHESAHLMSGDAARATAQNQRTSTIVGVAGALVGANRSLIGLGGESAVDSLASTGYSREQELSADAHGAELCAAAGINPWGLVWLLQKFQRSDAGGRLEFLADHPTEAARIDALEDEFRASPETYGRFPIEVENASALRKTEP